MVCKRYNLSIQRVTQHVRLIIIIMVVFCFLIGFTSFLGSKSEASDDISYKYYTSVEVKNGDTLWDIASEHITEEYSGLQEYVTEVKELNGLSNDNIRSGQSLIIPYYSLELK